MEFEEFNELLSENLKKLNIVPKDEKNKKLYKYMNLLIEWNNKINLTAIIEPKDIIIKHFIDSLTINQYIKEDSKLIDVGTGAGFPGLPIAIYRDDVKVILLDSLNKRINFLKEIIKELSLENVEVFHGRAEDFGSNKMFREKFDIAVSRAVAPMNVLSEYLIPFVKTSGIAIAMKGPNYIEETKNIDKVLRILGAKLEKIDNLKDNNNERNIIIFDKISETKKIYPRKAGTPSKEPLK